MNKLLCVTGFVLCFSSFCMNEDAIHDAKRGATTSCGETPTGPIAAAIWNVVSAIREKRFVDAADSLKASLSDKAFNINATFVIGEKEYTLLSWYLSRITIYAEKAIQDIYDWRDKLCSESLLRKMLLGASKDQLYDKNRYKKPCYIKENDQRIIDILSSAIDSTNFIFVNDFYNDCISSRYLDYNITFMKEGKKHTFLSLYLSRIKSIKTNTKAIFDYACRFGCTLLLGAFIEYKPSDKMQEECFIGKNDPRIIDVLLYAIDIGSIDFFLSFFISANRSLDAGSFVENKYISSAVFSACMSMFQDMFANRRLLSCCKDFMLSEFVYRSTKSSKDIIDLLSFLLEKKYNKIVYFLLRKSFSNGLDANSTFVYRNKDYTPLSFCLPFLQAQMDCVDLNEASTANLVNFLLEKSKDQLSDKNKYTESCYIKENDPRIIDLLKHAITNKRFEFLHSFVFDCLSNGYLSSGTTFMNDDMEECTFLSFCLSFLKFSMGCVGLDEKKAANLATLMFEKSKDQLTSKMPEDCYLKKYNQGIIDLLKYAIVNKRFEFLHSFVYDCLSNGCLSGDTIFMNDDMEECTLLSFCLSFLKSNIAFLQAEYLCSFCGELKKTEHVCRDNGGRKRFFLYRDPLEEKYLGLVKAVNVFVDLLLKTSKHQLTDKSYTESCYIQKNDPRIIDVLFFAINSACTHFAFRFRTDCCVYGYLDTSYEEENPQKEYMDLCRYLCTVESESLYTRTTISFNVETLRESVAKCLDFDGAAYGVISFLTEKQYHRIVYFLLRESFFNGLDANSTFRYHKRDYAFLSFCLSFLQAQMSCLELNEFDAADLVNFLLEKSKDQLSGKNKYTESCYIKKNDPRIIDLLKYAIVNKRFKFVYYFLKSCLEYKYLIDINFLFEYQKKNYTLLSLCSACVLEDQEAFYRESLSKKAVDAAKTIFSCDTRYCEKDYALIAFFSFFALEDEDASYVEKLRGDKKYFEENCFRIAGDDGVLKQLIEKTQGSQRDSLDLLKNNTSPENLVYQNYKPLCNDLEQYRKTIHKRGDDGYIICIDIIKMMQYYQE